MASEQLKLVIDVAAKDAVRETKNLSKAVKDASGEFKDMRSNAEKARDAVEAAASALVADLKKSEAAADALGQALGPELAARLGDDKIDAFIADLKRMGLTFEEIEQNADMFATSLRKIDGDSSGLRNVESGLQRVGRETDQSRSVLANMVGNSAQDLAALGGVAGSAGVMLGQLGEYAADGNIKLSNLAMLAGPMAGLAGASLLVSEAMKASAAKAEMNRERVEALTAALREGKTAADALDEALTVEDNGTVEFYDAAEGEISDLIPALFAAGATLEQFKAKTQLSAEEFDAWARSLFAGKEVGSNLNKILQAGYQTQQQLADATARAAMETFVLGTAASETTPSIHGMGEAARESADKTQALADALTAAQNQLDQRSSFLSAAEALAAMKQSLDSTEDGFIQNQRATLNAQQAVVGYLQSLGNIPDSEITKIIAMLDAGNYNFVLGKLVDLARARDVIFRPKLIVGGEKDDYAAAAKNAADEFITSFNQSASQAVTSGGGGGGGGGSSPGKEIAKKTIEDIRREWDRIKGSQFETGSLGEKEYRAYLTKRLGQYKKFSEDYMRVWRELRALDEEDKKAAEEKAEAEKKAAEERKKAAEKKAKDAEEKKRKAEEAARKAREEADAELQRQAMRAIVNANVMGASYANIYTSADPNAVVAALKQWQRNNGPLPVKTTG